MASLIVIAGKSRGLFFHVEPPGVTVGRDEACDIQVLDEQVSRRHFTVEAADAEGRFKLVDLGSSNGTLVDGGEVGETTLRDGNVILVGSTKLLFTTKEFPDRETAMDFFKIRGEHDKRTMIARGSDDPLEDTHQ